MTDEQTRHWKAIQARLRRGLLVEVGLEQCLQAGLPVVGIVRHHFGRQTDPKFGTTVDVSAEYGIAHTEIRKGEKVPG